MDLIKIRISKKGEYSVEGLDCGDESVHRIIDRLSESLGIETSRKQLHEPVRQEVVYDRTS